METVLIQFCKENETINVRMIQYTTRIRDTLTSHFIFFHSISSSTSSLHLQFFFFFFQKTLFEH